MGSQPETPETTPDNEDQVLNPTFDDEATAPAPVPLFVTHVGTLGNVHFGAKGGIAQLIDMEEFLVQLRGARDSLRHQMLTANRLGAQVPPNEEGGNPTALAPGWVEEREWVEAVRALDGHVEVLYIPASALQRVAPLEAPAKFSEEEPEDSEADSDGQ